MGACPAPVHSTTQYTPIATVLTSSHQRPAMVTLFWKIIVRYIYFFVTINFQLDILKSNWKRKIVSSKLKNAQTSEISNTHDPTASTHTIQYYVSLIIEYTSKTTQRFSGGLVI